jgi:anti-sigma B factor antagonist
MSEKFETITVNEDPTILRTSYKRCDVVKMSGRVDGYTTPHLRAALETIMEEGRFNLVFDMTDVDFLSSKGVNALVKIHTTCKKMDGGRLVTVGMSERIQETLKIVALDSYFERFPTITDAVGNF